MGNKRGKPDGRIKLPESKDKREDATTNPYNANQWQLDPRQKVCWDYYTDPKSETFGNATQSSLRAGYTEAYSDQITLTDWFMANLWRLNATATGEKKLKELLELDLMNGGDRVDVGIARLQGDIAKLLVTTQGKLLGYSTRTEVDHTNKGEKFEGSVSTEAVQAIKDKYEKELKETLTKKHDSTT